MVVALLKFAWFYLWVDISNGVDQRRHGHVLGTTDHRLGGGGGSCLLHGARHVQYVTSVSRQPCTNALGCCVDLLSDVIPLLHHLLVLRTPLKETEDRDGGGALLHCAPV